MEKGGPGDVKATKIDMSARREAKSWETNRGADCLDGSFADCWQEYIVKQFPQERMWNGRDGPTRRRITAGNNARHRCRRGFRWKKFLRHE
ncbi:hypothetical protein M514_07542 [Trichuris suis]|uniref:Uncharacterized protein n=1 Tax=Trichuris suis TaxID=68888 RepID=A0A085NEB3_9BILA|nr:hypothetical protein M513_07542 [Trichuris suis]KFD67809.1 hypothetical protein M514_07542 [Trichuris suis]